MATGKPMGSTAGVIDALVADNKSFHQLDSV
jgi:hypothetical protein